LHGGPGSGASPKHRRFFDPQAYRIVIFDQRGAGRSRPVGALKNNTTQHLIADMEQLRQLLGIQRWLVFGGSWGSTLALAYGAAHPESCLGFIVRGVFLARQWEQDWFVGGLRHFYPDAWDRLVSHLQPEERGDILGAYYRYISDDSDPARAAHYAHAWSRYEGECSTLLPNPEVTAHFADQTVALGIGRIETHYFINQLFLQDNPILSQVERMRHLPLMIVQGRYDVLCPVQSAWELHQAWPGSSLHITPDAGHSVWEPGNQAALVAACEKMKAILA
jgi:proline iminopeptidase